MFLSNLCADGEQVDIKRVRPPRDWQASFVSNYAAMHLWEEWAETWAHYLHMVDALGTARSYGMVLSPPPLDGAGAPDMSIDSVHVDFDDFEDLIQA